jgi:hypothetical protein
LGGADDEEVGEEGDEGPLPQGLSAMKTTPCKPHPERAAAMKSMNRTCHGKSGHAANADSED